MFSTTMNPHFGHTDARRQSTTSPFFFSTIETPGPSTDYPHNNLHCSTPTNGVTHAPVSPSCSGQGYSILPLAPSPGGHPFTPSSSAGVQTLSRGEVGLDGYYMNVSGQYRMQKRGDVAIAEADRRLSPPRLPIISISFPFLQHNRLQSTQTHSTSFQSRTPTHLLLHQIRAACRLPTDSLSVPDFSAERIPGLP